MCDLQGHNKLFPHLVGAVCSPRGTSVRRDGMGVVCLSHSVSSTLANVQSQWFKTSGSMDGFLPPVLFARSGSEGVEENILATTLD